MWSGYFLGLLLIFAVTVPRALAAHPSHPVDPEVTSFAVISANLRKQNETEAQASTTPPSIVRLDPQLDPNDVDPNEHEGRSSEKTFKVVVDEPGTGSDKNAQKKNPGRTGADASRTDAATHNVTRPTAKPVHKDDTNYGAVPPSIGGDESEDYRGEYMPPDEVPYVKAETAWKEFRYSQKMKWDSNRTGTFSGWSHFRGSASDTQWASFGIAFVVFVGLHHYFLYHLPSRLRSLALFVWLSVALAYGSMVYLHLGRNAGVTWMTGYLFEFIFSVENIFVFHIITSAFGTGRRLTQRTLFVVVLCQILFQMVFYLGLAHWLRQIWVLPYLLGVWLVYIGVESAMNQDHSDLDIKKTAMYRAFAWVLGDRLYPEYVDENFFVYPETREKFCVTMLFVVTLCLLAVDFMLEIDVTLTKIQGLQNAYLNFSSSVVASFAMPELFFVARDLFERFKLLKYGVSFILLFFGAGMLLQDFFAISDLTSCGIIVIVMVVCIIADRSEREKAPGSER